MKDKELNEMEKGLCRKTASTLRLAGKKGIPVTKVVNMWFSSEAAKHLYGTDFVAIAQGPLYQLNSLFMEAPLLTKECGREYGFEELLYWAGYLFSYWMFLDDISWAELKASYDWEKILRNYSVLHTVSCKTAIDICKHEYMLS